MAKYQRNEGHIIAHQLMELADVIEGDGGDDIYVLDILDHYEYMKAKKALKKMIKMGKTYYNEMEETENDKT